MTQTIKEIKEILAKITDIDDERFLAYKDDKRAGVHTAIHQRIKQIAAESVEDERLELMLEFEKKLYDKGIERIAGIDEVGRGPLAGPVVAAAVVLPKNCKIKGLNDSKKIPKYKHRKMFDEILSVALEVGVGIVDNQRIDEINIYEATKEAMLQALSKCKEKPEHVLIDAMVLDMDIPQTKIIHGDARSSSIAAASIVAKVIRDELMKSFSEEYPGYDFEHNAGYGTAKHLTALKELGITPIHRKSYEPIKSMLEGVEKD